ncbi:MAG TPA: hypothetical protein VM052_00230 [Candidatus Limnocylindrales bacterium]|nr:hypothetical protein [Candidatus Limnocylindrales bacterium]
MKRRSAETFCDERGQALVICVLFLAIAAVAISGVRVAQERILDGATQRRIGEAAVEAATAVIADVYATQTRNRAASDEIYAALMSNDARESARSAAESISALNGGTISISEPAVQCRGGLVDVSITLGGRLYRAGFGASLCSQR